MGLEISHVTMKKMVGLGLGLEIHILSYGGVITGDEQSNSPLHLFEYGSVWRKIV